MSDLPEPIQLPVERRERRDEHPIELRAAGLRLICSHCHDARSLKAAIAHIDHFHAACWSCQLERRLCEAGLRGELLRIDEKMPF